MESAAEHFKHVIAAVGDPGARILVAFPSYRQRDWWVREFAEPLTLAGGKFDAIGCRWTFVNGSRMDLHVMADRADIQKVRGITFTDGLTPFGIADMDVLDAIRAVVRRPATDGGRVVTQCNEHEAEDCPVCEKEK